MARKTKQRRIKAAKISLISLVPAGANQVRSLFKDKNAVQFAAVAKMDNEGYLTTLVYVPDEVDSQGDFADVETIKQMAHDFLPNMEGNGIDVLHDCNPVGNERAHICETFLVQKDDPRFEGITKDDGTPLDPAGSWGVVIKIDDPDLRSRYATGEWVGVSMFGSAIVEPVTKNSEPKPQETTMDPEKMAELLKKNNAELAEQIVTGLSKALKPEPEEPAEPVQKKPEPVAFEGDPHNPEDIQKHADKVLFASLDLSKPADVQKWQEHIAKRAAERKASEDPAQAELRGQIEKLQAKLEKMQKGTTAGEEPNVSPEPTGFMAGLAKGRERAERLKKAGVIR